jgi:hypothetical protein
MSIPITEQQDEQPVTEQQILEEARRRLHTDPEFHARVQMATRAARLMPGSEMARNWLRTGAALALVAAELDPATGLRNEEGRFGALTDRLRTLAGEWMHGLWSDPAHELLDVLRSLR